MRLGTAFVLAVLAALAALAFARLPLHRRMTWKTPAFVLPPRGPDHTPRERRYEPSRDPP